MNKLIAHVVGFIDIGTNPIRLLLVRIESNGGTTTISGHKETVFLSLEKDDLSIRQIMLRKRPLVW